MMSLSRELFSAPTMQPIMRPIMHGPCYAPMTAARRKDLV